MGKIPEPTDDPDQARCKHCWHEIPLSVVINDGRIQRYYQCCQCGIKKREETPLDMRKSVEEILAMIKEEEEKHGPYLPRGLKWEEQDRKR